MARKRRQHSAQFKFEVVMTMLRGEQTVAELCWQYDITESLPVLCFCPKAGDS